MNVKLYINSLKKVHMIYLVTSELKFKEKNAWIVDALSEENAKQCVIELICIQTVYNKSNVDYAMDVIDDLQVECVNSGTRDNIIIKSLTVDFDT